MLEEILRNAEEIELCRGGRLWPLATVTPEEKTKAYDKIHGWLRAVDEATQRRVVRALADHCEIDMAEMCCNLIMSWDEIRTIAADPLVTIGANTKAHYALAKLGAGEGGQRDAGQRRGDRARAWGEADASLLPLWR